MDTEEGNTRITRPGQRSGARLYGALAGLMITTFLVALDVTIIATAIPSILSAFRTTGDIGWYGAAYSLTLCSLQPVIGKCASLFPLRTVYQLLLAMFLLGSLICATATSRIMFLAARGVAGAGAAGLSTGGLSIIAAMAPVDKRPMFTSLVLSLYAIGTVIAPVLGGVLTEKVSWRWCCVHPLKGIFHMAMSLKDKSFSQMTHNEWHTALEAKVTGTWNLHHVLRQVEGLEFFLLFSSASEILGQPGQANYAAANVFMDAFVQYRHSLGLPASVIDIGVVGDVGYVSGYTNETVTL